MWKQNTEKPSSVGSWSFHLLASPLQGRRNYKEWSLSVKSPIFSLETMCSSPLCSIATHEGKTWCILLFIIFLFSSTTLYTITVFSQLCCGPILSSLANNYWSILHASFITSDGNFWKSNTWFISLRKSKLMREMENYWFIQLTFIEHMKWSRSVVSLWPHGLYSPPGSSIHGIF